MIEQNLKKESFGQIQIITKTLLIMSGIFIIDRIAANSLALSLPFYSTSVPAFIFYAAANIIFIVLILHFIIFNNSWLVKKILPAEEPLNAEDEKLWFSASLRIGLVFCGLVFIPSCGQGLIITIKFILNLPSAGTQFTSDLFYGARTFELRDLSHFRINLYNFFKMIFSIYFLAGSPGFITWNMKQAGMIQNKRN